MKKLLAVLIAAFMAAPLFAQKQLNTNEIKTKLVAALEKSSVAESVQGVRGAMQMMEQVTLAEKSIKNLTYPKWPSDTKEISAIAQEIALKMMDNYNALRRVDINAAHEMGALLAKWPFQTKDGTTFYIEEFIQQYAHEVPSFTLGTMYDELVDFKDHLREDAALKKTESLAKWPNQTIAAEAKKLMANVEAAGKQIQANYNYPKNGGDTKAISDISQVIVLNVMDDYNTLRQADMESAHVMGAYIANKDFTTKDGKKFRIGNFIQMFAGNVPSFTMGAKPLYNELSDFNDHLREDVALVNK